MNEIRDDIASRFLGYVLNNIEDRFKCKTYNGASMDYNIQSRFVISEEKDVESRSKAFLDYVTGRAKDANTIITCGACITRDGWTHVVEREGDREMMANAAYKEEGVTLLLLVRFSDE